MKLTENFTLEELLASQVALKEGIDNSANEQQVSNLKTLAEKVLQPIRDLYGKPMIIDSGFRCPALNKAVGGVNTSQHLYGEAADIAVKGNIYDLVMLIKNPENKFVYDQLIYYPRRNFLHISYREGRNRMQYLVK